MKKSTKSIIALGLTAVMIAAIPTGAAFATFRASAPLTASQKAGLATCAAVDKAVAFATAFSTRKKSKDAAAEKAKAVAAMATLKSDFEAIQSALNAAIRDDNSYRSWQSAASAIESFNGNNGAALESALATIDGYCAKLKK